MPAKLRKLKLDRVDLVPAGANPQADIMLYKSADVAKATFNQIQSARELDAMLSEVCRYTWDLQDAIYSSLYSTGNRAAEITQSVDQFAKAVETALDSWLAGKPLSKEEKEAVAKAVATIAKARETATLLKEETVSKTTTEVEKKEDQPTPPAPAPVAAAPIVKTDDMPEAVKKAIDAQNEVIAKQADEIKKANERVAKAEAEAAIEKEKRETTEFIQKAREELPNLSGTAEEKGAVLQKMAKSMSKEDYDKAVTLMKSGDAAVATLLKTEHGSGNGDDSSDGTAVSDLKKAATEIRKAEPKLSEAQAFRKACNDNPALYKQYQQERNRSTRVQ